MRNPVRARLACFQYFVEAGAIAVRRVKKEDLRRIAKATGATVCLTLASMEGDETFDPAQLGQVPSGRLARRTRLR